MLCNRHNLASSSITPTIWITFPVYQDGHHGKVACLLVLKGQPATNLVLHFRTDSRPILHTKISCSPFSNTLKVPISNLHLLGFDHQGGTKNFDLTKESWKHLVRGPCKAEFTCLYKSCNAEVKMRERERVLCGNSLLTSDCAVLGRPTSVRDATMRSFACMSRNEGLHNGSTPLACSRLLQENIGGLLSVTNKSTPAFRCKHTNITTTTSGNKIQWKTRKYELLTKHTDNSSTLAVQYNFRPSVSLGIGGGVWQKFERRTSTLLESRGLRYRYWTRELAMSSFQYV